MRPAILSILVGVVLLVLAGPGAGLARAVDNDRAAQIKAGMVLNFIRYTEWPQDCFAAPDSPLVVTVLGDGPIAALIGQTVKGQQANGRSIELRSIQYPKPGPGESAVPEERLRAFHQQLRSSHVLFVCESERDRVEPLVKEVARSNVLTVSDIDRFAERGGMIGLVIRNDKVAFDANQKAIKQTQLKVSSQVLRLARLAEQTQ